MLSRARLQTLALLICLVRQCRPVCVDVLSETEAVLGRTMKLTCIFCMKREEAKVTTTVEWFHTNDKRKIPILTYNGKQADALEGPLKDRLIWNGSQDLQDLSIRINNVTYNDSGLYECVVNRTFQFDNFSPTFSEYKNITLRVKEQASADTTALYSEIMMYVLLVFLTFWLLVEMVYCYRKISKSDEQAQDTAY